MRLPDDVYRAVDGQHVRVFQATRQMTRFWNDNRGPNDLRYYGGWYWYVEKDGRAQGNENGPYRTKSAAYRAAFLELSLKREPKKAKTTQVTGSNVIAIPQPKSSSREDRALHRRLRRYGVG